MIKYAIKLKNGQYARQNWDDSTFKYIRLDEHDSPLYADFFDKDVAYRVLSEILSGNTNHMVLYNEFNPPIEVVALDINIKEIN